jgi:hypothetical protein
MMVALLDGARAQAVENCTSSIICVDCACGPAEIDEPFTQSAVLSTGFNPIINGVFDVRDDVAIVTFSGGTTGSNIARVGLINVTDNALTEYTERVEYSSQQLGVPTFKNDMMFLPARFSGEIHVLNVSVPLPENLAEISTMPFIGSTILWASIDPDDDNVLYVTSEGGSGFYSVDISDPTSLSTISSSTTSFVASGIDCRSYSALGEVYCVVGAPAASFVFVFNVTDPTNMVVSASFNTSSTMTDPNQILFHPTEPVFYVAGRSGTVSTGAQLAVFSLDDPTATPVLEASFLDTSGSLGTVNSLFYGGGMSIGGDGDQFLATFWSAVGADLGTLLVTYCINDPTNPLLSSNQTLPDSYDDTYSVLPSPETDGFLTQVYYTATEGGATNSRFASIGFSMCGNGIIESGEDCDGGPCCNNTTCAYIEAQENILCRLACDLCEDNAFCPGNTSECPYNFSPNTTLCVDSEGVCQEDVFCTGNNQTCPSDGLLPNTTVCQSAVSACEVDVFCTGDSSFCPAEEVPLGQIQWGFRLELPDSTFGQVDAFDTQAVESRSYSACPMLGDPIGNITTYNSDGSVFYSKPFVENGRRRMSQILAVDSDGFGLWSVETIVNSTVGPGGFARLISNGIRISSDERFIYFIVGSLTDSSNSATDIEGVFQANADGSIFETIDDWSIGRRTEMFKYTSNGFGVWSVRTEMPDISASIARSGVAAATTGVDLDGNVYCPFNIRYQQGASSPPPTISQTLYNSDGSVFAEEAISEGLYGILAKYDSDGFGVWAARIAFGGAGGSRITGSTARDLSSSGDGRLCVIGIMKRNTVVFNEDGTTFRTVPFFGTLGPNRLFIGCYNRDGEAIWAATSSGVSSSAATPQDTATIGENVYAVGWFLEEMVIRNSDDSVAATLTAGAPTDANDLFLIKYDSTGNVLWATSVEGAGSETSFQVSPMTDGGVSIGAGFGSSLVSIYNSDGSLFRTYDLEDGSQGMIYIRYDSDGFGVWAAEAKASTSIRAGDSDYDDVGAVIISGPVDQSTEALFFDNNGTQSLTLNYTGPSSGRGGFIVKYTDIAFQPGVAPNTTLCRNATFACEADTFCNGFNTTCPESEFLPNTTICLNTTMNGVCGTEVFCTGNDLQCPSDNPYAPCWDQCYTGTDPDCDPDLFCTGADFDCPQPEDPNFVLVWEDGEIDVPGGCGNLINTSVTNMRVYDPIFDVNPPYRAEVFAYNESTRYVVVLVSSITEAFLIDADTLELSPTQISLNEFMFGEPDYTENTMFVPSSETLLAIDITPPVLSNFAEISPSWTSSSQLAAVSIDEQQPDIAYVSSSGGEGLLVVNISNPANIQLVAQTSLSFTGQSVACRYYCGSNDTTLADRQYCVVSTPGTGSPSILRTVDVTDWQNPVVIMRYTRVQRSTKWEKIPL